ncbi:MAG: type I secretion C-terminal target domain-containing protein [Vibrio sp.]|uniref:cadherin repeat domain-containing protein n=1 Tax=Vibrio sp. TaxID=678 RepID=UPI003A87D34A
MNARTLSQFMLANVTLVIDRQGQIRELAAGAAPAPGEVIVTVGDGANPQVTAQEVLGGEGQTPLNINFDAEIANIIAQLEDGIDPTLNADQATAAGRDNGSALGNSGTVVMQLATLIAATAFSTSGFARDFLSQTDSLNVDFTAADDPIQNLVGVSDNPPDITLQDDPVNSPPVFVDTEYTTDDDEEYENGNEFIPDSGSQAMYSLYYGENTTMESPIIGRVAANDLEGDTLSYEITGGNDSGYFEIDDDGFIKLTTTGLESLANNYESGINDHVIQVSVSDGTNTVLADVKLFERNVNEAPEAENFTVTFSGTEQVNVVFNTDIGLTTDHISDEDVDYFTQNPINPQSAGYDEYQDLYWDQKLSVVISSLPTYGTLYYDGVEIESIGDVNKEETWLDPDLITYSSSGSISPKTFILDDHTELLSGIHVTGNSYKDAYVTYLPGNPSLNSGTGYGVSNSKGDIDIGAGAGINNPEILILDLTDNQLTSVNFTLSGINPGHETKVTYTYLVDGELVNLTSVYAPSVGSNTIDVSYTPPANSTLVQIQFLGSDANYVVGNLTGTTTSTIDDDSFTYRAVDSDGMYSDEKTVTLDGIDTTETYDTQIPNPLDGIVMAETGTDVMIGDDSQANIFTWLDSVLDNSTDTVKNFEFGVDKIDLTSILDDDTSTTDISDLLGKVTINTVNNEDVVLTVEHGDSGSQTIVIEDIYSDVAAMDASAILDSLVKLNTETV